MPTIQFQIGQEVAALFYLYFIYDMILALSFINLFNSTDGDKSPRAGHRICAKDLTSSTLNFYDQLNTR
jgi:hypothetical protein